MYKYIYIYIYTYVYMNILCIYIKKYIYMYINPLQGYVASFFIALKPRVDFPLSPPPLPLCARGLGMQREGFRDA